jgi:flagellar protein FlaF
MYESVLAEKSYANPGRSTATPRNVEYQAFARVTGQLSSASRDGAEFGKLAQALQDNLSLWTVLGTDVAGAANGLPSDLKAKLFYLFEFTRAHTVKVMNREATADVLIDINSAIMRGLRGARQAEAAS